MTKKVLIQSKALEQAAERAGGFVAAPGTLKPNPKKENEFALIRKYSLQHGIPISMLTQDDYKKMGIQQ